MSILGGLVIGLCAIIYVNVENTIIGAMLFSLGLCAVLINKYNLYTGKIGFATKNWKSIKQMLKILFWNIVGVAFITMIVPHPARAESIAAAKLITPPIVFFSKSICCGVMMYLAVTTYKNTSNVIPVILCIMGFILAGFEHCIADLAYFILGLTAFSWKAILYFIIAVIGNTIGSKLIHILEKE